MVSKKSVLLSIILIGILVFSVGFVNAGWFDKITGKATSPATAKVQVGGILNPPDVFFVSGPTRTDLNPGGVMVYSFSFLVYSAGGLASLPPNGGIIFGAFNGTVGAVSNRRVDRTSCNYIGPITVNYKGTPNTIVANYSCNIDMLYYYEPTTWTINATVSDITGKMGTNDTYRTFNLANLYAWDLQPNSINWTGIQVGDLNKPADYSIKINNTGNVDIGISGHDFKVQSADLTGKPDIFKSISGTLFAANDHEATPCDGSRTMLSTATANTVSFLIDHKLSSPAGAASNNLGFCLTNTGAITPQDYESSGLSWSLTSS